LLLALLGLLLELLLQAFPRLKLHTFGQARFRGGSTSLCVVLLELADARVIAICRVCPRKAVWLWFFSINPYGPTSLAMRWYSRRRGFARSLTFWRSIQRRSSRDVASERSSLDSKYENQILEKQTLPQKGTRAMFEMNAKTYRSARLVREKMSDHQGAEPGVRPTTWERQSSPRNAQQQTAHCGGKLARIAC